MEYHDIDSLLAKFVLSKLKNKFISLLDKENVPEILKKLVYEEIKKLEDQLDHKMN